MANIKTISYEQSEGRLREIYNDLIETRGKLANVHTIQSLRPESIVKHIDLYMEIMFSRSDLSRADREMIAVVVSSANNCKYCQIHHGEALNQYWKNNEKVRQLGVSRLSLSLAKRETLLCDYAEELTLNPSETTKSNLVDGLKEIGLTENAILDATLVVAYFNFVNRMVLGLEVDIEDSAGKGYTY